MNSWKRFYKALPGATATWTLAGINAVTFMVILATGAGESLSLSASLATDLLQPWRLVTYMFAQRGAAHLLGNLIPLILAGVEYERRRGGRNLVLVYMTGGLAGAVAFLAVTSTSGVDAVLTGCSGSVLAVLAALLCGHSRSLIRSILSMALLVLVLGVGVLGPNPAGSMAHVAGLLAGAILGITVNNRMERRQNNLRKSAVEKALRSGYASLSNDEQQLLNK